MDPSLQALSPADLAGLPGWTLVESLAPGTGATRRELSRSFRFGSFPEALDFMQAAVPQIEAADHHPRWENVFKTVTVWLSTHEAGHVPTSRDLALARHLDALFAARTPAGG